MARMQIFLKSYDHQLLDSVASKIVETVQKEGGNVSGPVPLPTKKEIFTVLRSPHVNKDSREQFERRTHKRLVIIIDPNERIRNAMRTIDVPSGINIYSKVEKLVKK
ncbi:MAG: 30S ribosomal protein S10 [Acholeplasmatales bacterium]|jgi:small subunit ribosomal protein S10|nr:30S ribosomal protein S10 [Acholeplasmatales bacterium]